ncbi:MAG: acyl-CoA dehydrogenase [Rhizobiales bacterium PAR1]|nr:MAG: acyl-CoA dehydrogenase [Rhizobiales bacterium PAR1]
MSFIALDDPDNVLALLRDSVATFGERNPGPARLRQQRSQQRLDRKVWTSFAESGWIGLQVPEEAGGAGLSSGAQAAVCEMFGRNLMPEPYAVLAVLVPQLLGGLPTGASRDALLAGLIAGERIVTLGFAAHGGAPALRARVAGQGRVLEGTLAFVEAFDDADDLLAVAETPSGVALFRLDPRAGGLTARRRAGVDGAPLTDLTFASVTVSPADCLAEAPSGEALLGVSIAAARLALAAELAGLAAKALEETVEYTRTRVQFGKAIASFQVIQHRLVDMWIQSELANAAVRNAVVQTERTPGSAVATQAVCAAKARASDASFSICRNAIHLHGAMGITDECNIGLYLKRAINLGACLGNADAMRDIFLRNDTHH